MSKELLFPSLVTVLSLMLYFIFTGLVGSARGKFNVPAPATTGNPDFERRFRVQQNTVEQLVCFLPGLWVFSMIWSPIWGSVLGGVWILGRIVYAAGYYKAAEKRGPGFAITALATNLLLLGSLVGIVLQFVKGM